MKKLVCLLLAAMMLLGVMPAAMAAPTQEIIFALQDEPDGIDPGVTNNSFASPFLGNCFEGLVTYDTTTGSLIGGNAETWEISEDGTVYTFHLREGLKWSDGSALTAKDYLYAFKRILTPETTAQYLTMVTDYIVGAQEYYDGTGSEEALGVKAVDDTTLVLTLKATTPYYIDILTMWTFSPIQQATVEANGDKWTSTPATYISNGPFMISEMNMGESIVLVKNPNYYNADQVSLEKITFRYIKDPSTAMMAFESGEITGSRTVPASDYTRLKLEEAGVVVATSYGTVYYNFNCAAAPFDNALVRKAFCLAVDRMALLDDVLQVPGEPAYSFIAPNYSVDGVGFADDRSTFGMSENADIEGAQAALTEAGYPNGEGFPEVTLSYYSNESVKVVVEAMAEMLQANLNIKIKIENSEWSIYYPDVQAGKFQVCAMGWSADYLHPMTFLPLARTNDPNNLGFWSNAEYDALVEAAQTETDATAAMKLMQDADNIASGDYYCLPLYYKSNMLLMSNNVTGYYLDPSNMLFLRNAKVVE